MSDYTVLTAYSAAALRKLVLMAMDEGWIPQGGVSVSQTITNTCCDIYAQALIKP